MENNDYNRFYELFRRYGAYAKFDVSAQEVRTLDFAGTSLQCQVAGPTTINMNAVFQSPNGFNHFVGDMNRLADIIDEEHRCRDNPTLQRAYEEYQLLLKLSR